MAQINQNLKKQETQVYLQEENDCQAVVSIDSSDVIVIEHYGNPPIEASRRVYPSASGDSGDICVRGGYTYYFVYVYANEYYVLSGDSLVRVFRLPFTVELLLKRIREHSQKR